MGRNYGESVGPRGGVANQQEYAEQQALLEDAAVLSQQLPWWDFSAASGIAAGVAVGIDAGPPDEVLRDLQRGFTDLKRDHDLGLAPPARPSWQSGKELYEEACATCHGSNGSGYGPAMLFPRPPTLRDPRLVRKLSPAGVFGVVSYGVFETPMPNFSAAYPASDRWAIAFYALSIARPASTPLAAGYPELRSYPLKDLATRTDDDLFADLKSRGDSQGLALAQLDYLRAVAPFVDR